MKLHYRARTMLAAVLVVVLLAGAACRNEEDSGPVTDVPDFDATTSASAAGSSLSQLSQPTPDATTAPVTPLGARSRDKDGPTQTGRRTAGQVTATATAVGTAVTPAMSRPATATRAPRSTATPTATSVPPTRTPRPEATAATATQAIVPSPTPVPPTAVPPTATAVPATPTPVPPSNPPAEGSTTVSRMSIPSLGVDYPIEVLGTTDNGTRLDTPHNATGAIGWYQLANFADFAVPGAGGNAVFSAHINYNGADGPFANLASIGPGAEISVTMANGVVYRYAVFAIQGYVVNASYATAERSLINMDDLVYTPNRPAGEEWVTLITCSCDPGRVIVAPGAIYGECVDRDVVVARRVS